MTVNVKLVESGLQPASNNPLVKGNRPLTVIVMDSRIKRASIYDVDKMHRNNGITMFAYHFYITKEGIIYVGRPENTYGNVVENSTMHNLDRNKIMICLEGYFSDEKPTQAQKMSLKMLNRYLISMYPNITHIYTLDELLPETNNPGILFPANEMRSEAFDTMQPLFVDTPCGIRSYSYGLRDLRYNPDAIMGGNDIEVYQYYLNAIGYKIDIKNGYFDIYTELATKEFQKNSGLKVDGIATREVFDKINEIYDKMYTKVDPKRFRRILKLMNPPMEGEDIGFIKQKLNETNFNIEKLDKIFDDNLRTEVTRFQTAKGMAIDGIIGPLTFHAIKSFKTVTFTRLLKYTVPPMEGEDIKEIQLNLAKLNLYKNTINGIFDINTKIAVANFQATKFIKVTGEVDETTFNLIMNRVL